MKVDIDEEKRLVYVWIECENSGKPEAEDAIKQICAQYSSQNYKVVVFRSGSGNLSDLLEALIRNNRFKFAQEELQNSSKQT